MMTIHPHPYQEEAIDKALENGFSLIAYEMGLGKTVCAIVIVEELLDNPSINFALIVVPSALKYQWAEAIAKFTDVTTRQFKVRKSFITIPTEEYCVVVDGPPKKREKQYDYIEANWPNYVIVSYEQVVNDWDRIWDLAAECVVLDEATAIKGFRAKRSKKVKQLDPEFAVALTGTPIENRPEELFSIMQFVKPNYLGSYEAFDAKFIVRYPHGGVKRYRNLDILNNKMLEVMSRKRRTDPDVAPYMPDVDEKNVYVSLDSAASKAYRIVADEILKDLKEMKRTDSFDLSAYYSGEGGDMTEQGKIMAKVLFLRMLCDHPDLIRASAAKFEETKGEEGSQYAWKAVSKGLLDNVTASPKVDEIVEYVRDILDSSPKNKVIIFSFFKQMGSIVKDRLGEYESVLFNGDMNSSQKAEAKARFQNEEDCRLFIASDAGGYGVDLPQANYLINIDLADSVGKMDQRNARHVRASSEFDNVFVLNFLIADSIEERQFDRLEWKRTISQAVIDGKKVDEGGVLENDVETLGEFLAK